ncbi:MAG: hypothetical protein JWO36_4068 [Myxococcales bacterium]|nr:hypothetical protein [Myxococcales bacterium]
MSSEVSRHVGAHGALALAQQIGFRAVELIPSMFGADHGRQPSLPDDTEVAALRAALDAHGLQAVSANAVFMPLKERWAEEDQFVPAAFRDLIARASPGDYARYMIWLTRIAGTLGIKTINCLGLPFVAPTAEASLGAFVDGMRPVLESAREHGVVVCIEHEALDPLTRFEPGLRSVMTAIDHPSFGLTIDISNLFAAGIEPYPYAYRQFKPWIKHVHVRGARRARDTDPPESKWFERMTSLGESRQTVFTSLRDGAVNVHGLVSSLVEDSYQGFITLQPLARGAELAELPRILEDDFAFMQRARA